tara:strand:- start:2305 stop:2694 length:390 start_codon:yes stop_codon:yes gene_type:complete
MNYRQIIWKLGNKKVNKSPIEKTNIILEKKLERHKDDIVIQKNHNFLSTNAEHNLNLINFRENIEITIENKATNRDLLEKRLSGREKMHSGWVNPFLPTNKYLEDLSKENEFLRPQNTNINTLKNNSNN